MKLQRTLGFWDVYAIALGQVIGSGIMVLVGIGIELTAYAIPLAFLVSAGLSLLKQWPIAFLGSAMPATGGLYVYCKPFSVRGHNNGVWAMFSATSHFSEEFCGTQGAIGKYFGTGELAVAHHVKVVKGVEHAI